MVNLILPFYRLSFLGLEPFKLLPKIDRFSFKMPLFYANSLNVFEFRFQGN